MAKSARAAPTGIRRRVGPTSPPAWVKPQLAKLVEKAPDGLDWLHEIKFDGYRMHTRLDAGGVQILTRRGNDWTAKYPAITKSITRLPAQNAYLDGEFCGVLPDGRTAFNLIQNATDTGAGSLVFFFFDILFLDGENLTALPLSTYSQIFRYDTKERRRSHDTCSEQRVKKMGSDCCTEHDRCPSCRLSDLGEDIIRLNGDGVGTSIFDESARCEWSQREGDEKFDLTIRPGVPQRANLFMLLEQEQPPVPHPTLDFVKIILNVEIQTPGQYRILLAATAEGLRPVHKTLFFRWRDFDNISLVFDETSASPAALSDVPSQPLGQRLGSRQ
jgi:hypothetical protein